MADEGHRSSPRIKIGAAFAAIVTVFGIWFAPGDAAQEIVCKSDLVADSPQFADNIRCDWGLRKIPVAEATTNLDLFLGRSGLGVPENGWQMLTAEVKAEHPGFIEAWTPTLFAERVGPLVPDKDEFNRFYLTYRTYSGDSNEAAEGEVDLYKLPVELVRAGGADDDVRVSWLGNLDRDDGSRQPYALAHPVVRTQSFNYPARVDVAGVELNPRSTLRLVCQIETATGEWWSAGGLGWVAHAYLDLGNHPAEKLAHCDDHHADGAAGSGEGGH